MDNLSSVKQESDMHLRNSTNVKLIKEQLDEALQKGLQSIKEGKVVSADDVDAILSKEFGI